MHIVGKAGFAIFALILALPAADAVLAQETPAKTWADVKCERYQKAWGDASAQLGSQGLGAEFISRHAAFIASNCTGKRDVCPRSEQELRMANVLVLKGMNAGFASTFFPFACREQMKEWRESPDPRHKP